MEKIELYMTKATTVHPAFPLNFRKLVEILMDIADSGYRVIFSSCPSNHRLKAAHQPGQVQKMCLKAAHQPGQIQNMRVHAGNKRGRVPLGKPQLALNAIPQKEQSS